VVVIDSDAHVEESVETWSYLPPEFYKFRPLPVVFPEDTCFAERNAAWVIDYKLRHFAATPTLMRQAREKGVPIPVQEMKDVGGRLEAMDEFGIDVQVVFPSAWLGTLAENVELEAALANSYNQFMAAQCKQSGGRICYVAVVAWRRPDLAIQEIRRVKQEGGAYSGTLTGKTRIASDHAIRCRTLRSGRSARSSQYAARTRKPPTAEMAKVAQISGSIPASEALLDPPPLAIDGPLQDRGQEAFQRAETRQHRLLGGEERLHPCPHPRLQGRHRLLAPHAGSGDRFTEADHHPCPKPEPVGADHRRRQDRHAGPGGERERAGLERQDG